MSSSAFSVGDLVWAKMKGYPPWPARISIPPANLKNFAKKKKGHQCCYFFGSENYSWIPDAHIYEHSEAMIPKNKKRESAQFRDAVDTIMSFMSFVSDGQSSTNEDDEQNFTHEDDEQNLASENDKQSLASNDDIQIIYYEDDKQNLVNEDDEQRLDNEDNEQSLASENAERSLPNEDDERNLANADAERSLANEDAERSLANEDAERSLANEDAERSLPNEDDEQSMANEDDEQNLANEDDEESLTNEDDIQSLASEDDGQSLASEDDGQSFANEDDRESLVNEDDDQSSTNGDEQNFAYEDAELSSASEDDKQSLVSENEEVKSIGNNCPYNIEDLCEKCKLIFQKDSQKFSSPPENSEANVAIPKKRKTSRKLSSSSEHSDENDDENITKRKRGRRIKKFKGIIRPIVSEDDTSQSSFTSETFYSVSSDEESQDESFSFVPGYDPDAVPKRTERPTYVERPSSPEFDIREESEIVRQRNISPVPHKIGFIGLSSMGKVLAKHILHSGHDLIVWNSIPEECEDFEEAGAARGLTPADVMAAADITFCCLSDTDAVRSIVFDNCGILDGMSEDFEKGFVILNAITPFASLEINSAITSRGGLFLEAFIHGTRTMAEKATLLVIAGGAHECFLKCCSCFRAIAKDVFYVNYDIGEAAIVKLLVSLLNACQISCIAGVMSFLNRSGCKTLAEFVPFLSRCRVSSMSLVRNANAIAEKDFFTDISVKYLLQCLTSALDLTNTVSTPTYIASLVQEHFKSASLLRYFDHDATAVYQAM